LNRTVQKLDKIWLPKKQVAGLQRGKITVSVKLQADRLYYWPPNRLGPKPCADRQIGDSRLYSRLSRQKKRGTSGAPQWVSFFGDSKGVAQLFRALRPAFPSERFRAFFFPMNNMLLQDLAPP
jgi:hypothetical protein